MILRVNCLLWMLFSFVVGWSQTEPRLVLPIGLYSNWDSEIFISIDFDAKGKIVLAVAGNEVFIYDSESGKELQRFEAHENGVYNARFSSNGKYILTSGGDGYIRIWESSSYKLIKSLWGGYYESDNGAEDKFLVHSDDSTLSIWDLRTLKMDGQISLSDDISRVALSPDGKLLLVLTLNDTAKLLDVDKKNSTLDFPLSLPSEAVFSPDGKLFMTYGIDGWMMVYNTNSKSIIGKIKLREPQAEFDQHYEIRALFSPDSQYILTEVGDDTITIWRSNTLELVSNFSGNLRPFLFNSSNYIFSPTCEDLLVARNDSLFILNLKSQFQVGLVAAGVGRYPSVAYNTSGTNVIVDDRRGLGLISIDLNTMQTTILGMNYSHPIDLIQYDVNRNRIVTASRKQINEWDLQSSSNQRCYYHENFIVQLECNSTNVILSSDYGGTTYLRDENSGGLIREYRGPALQVFNSAICVEKHFIANRSSDSSLTISNYITGDSIVVLDVDSGGPSPLESFEFSPDGSRILLSTEVKASLVSLESDTIESIPIGYHETIHATGFSGDGSSILTVSRPNSGRLRKVMLRSASDGSIIREYSLEHSVKFIVAFAFSPNDSILAIAGENEESKLFVVLLEVLTGDELAYFNLQDLDLDADWNYEFNLQFSPNSKLFAFARGGDDFGIWDCESNVIKLLVNDNFQGIGHSSSVRSLLFSRDSRHLISAGDDHKTIVWDVSSGEPLYTRIQMSDGHWLVYDEHYRFDGTPEAIEKLYFVCGLEVIELAQMKDSLWVPGLAEKIMTNQPILINDKQAPKLSELNICELTPVIEPIEQDDKRMLKYRITPRRGALGDTELYINGNLTYTYKPGKLEKKKEGSTTAYYLTIDSDTLQGYLAGEQYTANPVLIKSKVKGTGIYGRGKQHTIAKKSSKDDSHFYGVFIGVNDYGNERKEPNEQHYKNLDFAVKDAQDLSVAVEQTARNLFKDNCHIYRLTGEGNTPPTKDNLKTVLADIGSKSKASDVLYIFFAGHGDVRRMKDTLDQVVVEQDQIRFMMQRADKRNPVTTSFGVRELSEWCSPRRIKAQKRVFVFDACHSGKITQEAAGGFRGDDEGTRIRQLDKLKDKNGMMILAAAADDESAYEDETLNQGVLTYHLLQVMKEEAKDTSLVVRDWFDETIDLVKEYSRLNGNKQEPSSFGDGRFEIGNVRDNVRDSIKITCPKTRVGACEISAGSDEAEAFFPGVENKVLKYFSASQSRGNLVYSEKSDKAFRASGSFNADGNKISVRYKIKLGSEQIGQTITLPSRKYTNEDELVQAIVTSISQEIELLSEKDTRCKLVNK